MILVIMSRKKEFARRMNDLGGYSLKDPGRVKQWN